MSPVRVEHIGITHITLLNIVMAFEDHWLSMIPRTLWHIYMMSMMVSFHPFLSTPCLVTRTENTVITLSDW